MTARKHVHDLKSAAVAAATYVQGLEFDDVFLVDFCADSPAGQVRWRMQRYSEALLLVYCDDCLCYSHVVSRMLALPRIMCGDVVLHSIGCLIIRHGHVCLQQYPVLLLLLGR
jgi:hypothetical protein